MRVMGFLPHLAQKKAVVGNSTSVGVDGEKAD